MTRQLNILPGFALLTILFIQPATAQSTASTAGSSRDLAELRRLNALFIKNYTTSDTVSHNQIIHKDFVCIENSGTVVGRNDYMKEWSQSYKNGGYTSFTYADEVIRLFGNMALVRSKTISTKVKDGSVQNGTSMYVDTYIKENGRWWCVQAHITSVKTP